jgi:hypothetical protein
VLPAAHQVGALRQHHSRTLDMLASLGPAVPPLADSSESSWAMRQVDSENSEPFSRCRKRTCTSASVTLHALQGVPSDRTSVTLSVRTSVTVGWWLGGAALSVGAPLLPTQGSLTRSLSDGLWPPLTWEPLRRPWAG